MFVDRVRIHVRAGDGGAGVVSFVRSRGKPQGKPTGGSGGNGGDVIVVVDEGMASLLRYRRNPHHAAQKGSHGSGDLKHGKQGEDLVLPVPAGTIVRDDSGRVVADLVRHGQRATILQGGRGGRGNASFVSPRLRAPSVAEQGEYGAERTFELELKLMADAALVGFPNAGKSTFISRVSAAKPKVADYPFTTLEPHLGVVAVDDHEFVIADIPGLIEGAAEGRGLGHEFLRHVERARALVILLDPSPIAEHSPAEQYRILLAELEAFNPDLVSRPHVVLVGKSDLAGAESAVHEIPEATAVSPLTGDGLREALYRIAAAVDQARRDAPDRQGFVLHQPVVPPFRLRRDGRSWVVEGIGAERAVRFSDLTNPQAADLASDRLTRLGIDDALGAAGAEEGDTVRIGDLEFEFSRRHDDDWDEGEEE
ncbi:MAG TPA: GTPase ObgE [Acidimicrobiia bacterium]|nr:GTPase ObgE [Acidimicrobiia bacterium]